MRDMCGNTVQYIDLIHPVSFGYSRELTQLAIAIFSFRKTEKRKKMDKKRPRLEHTLFDCFL